MNNTTLTILLFYLPSLIGLTAVGVHIVALLKLAVTCKSKAIPFVFSFFLMAVGTVASWFVVFANTLILIEQGLLLPYSWQVLLLPIFWGVMSLWMNLLIVRK
ncbi:MAG: hypothetical protein PHN39_03725 [Candidatus Pacebacteria bacterium]|jgi:hypothetical protein|nr:hypothetical protein [Candidatus Paceibacterota bacterium]